MLSSDGAPFWLIKPEIFTIWLFREKNLSTPTLGFFFPLINYLLSFPFLPFLSLLSLSLPSFSLCHFFLSSFIPFVPLTHFVFYGTKPLSFSFDFTCVYVLCMVLYIYYAQIKTLSKCFVFFKMAFIPISRDLFACYTYGEIQSAVSCQHFKIHLNQKHVKPHNVN